LYVSCLKSLRRHVKGERAGFDIGIVGHFPHQCVKALVPVHHVCIRRACDRGAKFALDFANLPNLFGIRILRWN